MELTLPNNSDVIVSVPIGAESAIRVMANKEYGLTTERFDEGLSIVKGGQRDRIREFLITPPRWSFGSFVKASISFHDGETLTEKVSAEVTSALIRLIAETGLSGSRFRITTRARGDRITSFIMNEIIRSGERIGLTNDPTNYTLSLEVGRTDRQIYILVGLSFSVKERFGYRSKDVKGSINPVLAALLVRLAPEADKGIALDPTTGSGTLLFERLLFSNTEHGIGIDLNPEARNAFFHNLSSPLLNKVRPRAEFSLGDARQPRLWRKFDFGICNPPFGIKLKNNPDDLEALYKDILSNVESYMSNNGRMVFVTSFKSGADLAISATGGLKSLAQYKIWSGGLVYQTYVIGKR